MNPDGADFETKPGIYTSEFWITVFTNLFSIIDIVGIADYVPDRYAMIAIAIVNGLYAASRGVAKAGVPYSGKRHF